MAHNIHIIGSNTSTGRLELSDSGNTLAAHGTKVNWHIRTDSVTSIEIVQKPGPSDNVWETLPHPQGNHWTAKTISHVTRPLSYNYAINWRHSSGSQHTHDPIISMRPSGFDHRFKVVLIAVGVVAGAILALTLFRRKGHK